MPNLRDKLLTVVSKLRLLPTNFGVRVYQVFVRVSVRDASPSVLFDVPGAGTATVTETELVEPNGARPKVEFVNEADIIASGGLLSDEDLIVDFITPEHTTYVVGGIPSNLLEPTEENTATQITYRVSGIGIEEGSIFKKISTHTHLPFRYKIILRKIGVNDES
jgi:hypothetical protein